MSFGGIWPICSQLPPSGLHCQSGISSINPPIPIYLSSSHLDKPLLPTGLWLNISNDKQRDSCWSTERTQSNFSRHFRKVNLFKWVCDKHVNCLDMHTSAVKSSCLNNIFMSSFLLTCWVNAKRYTLFFYITIDKLTWNQSQCGSSVCWQNQKKSYSPCSGDISIK